MSNPNTGIFARFVAAFRAPAQAGSLQLWILRGCFGTIVIGMATLVLSQYAYDKSPASLYGILAFFAILAAGILVVFTDMLVRNKQITTISAIYFGLLLGFLLGWLFSMVLEPLEGIWLTREKAQAIRGVIIVVCCYISISTLLQTKDE